MTPNTFTNKNQQLYLLDPLHSDSPEAQVEVKGRQSKNQSAYFWALNGLKAQLS